MGEVYRGFDERLDRPVALKQVRNDSRSDETARERFRREAKAIARLSHPAVVQIFDWVETEDGAWFVMELVKGNTLASLIHHQGPMIFERAARIGAEIAGGLAAAHAEHIVHRDLKPENVQVLTRQGGDHVKLVDFGISRLLTQQEEDAEEIFVTMRGTLSGTPMYVAPEAILEPDDVTKGHDVYAAGVILYELLTGALPFDASRTLRDLLKDTVESRPKPLEIAHPGGEFPQPIKRLVARYLEKDPMARPPDGAAARELLRETQDVLAGRPPRRRAATTRQPGITARLLRKITGIFRRDTGSV